MKFFFWKQIMSQFCYIPPIKVPKYLDLDERLSVPYLKNLTFSRVLLPKRYAGCMKLKMFIIMSVTSEMICRLYETENVYHNVWLDPVFVLKISFASICKFLWWIVTDLFFSKSYIMRLLRTIRKAFMDIIYMTV